MRQARGSGAFIAAVFISVSNVWRNFAHTAVTFRLWHADRRRRRLEDGECGVVALALYGWRLVRKISARTVYHSAQRTAGQAYGHLIAGGRANIIP